MLVNYTERNRKITWLPCVSLLVKVFMHSINEKQK